MRDRYSERGGSRWDDEDRRAYESRARDRERGGYGPGDRGFFERAGDEVRSWFGDEDAQRRRIDDERDEGRGRGEWSGPNRGRDRDWSREPGDREWSRQWGYVEGSGPSYGDRSRESSRGYGDTSRGYERYGSGMSSYGSGTSTYGSGSSGYGSTTRGYGAWGRDRTSDRESWGGQGPGGFGSPGQGTSASGREWDWSGGGDWGRSGANRSWTSGPHSGRGPRNYQRSDERIREDICERLSDHSYLDPSDVEILVVAGEVTLQGTVNDRWAKRTAEELAEGVSGVKEVHNQLRVPHGTQGHETQDRENQTRGTTGQQQRGNWAA